MSQCPINEDKNIAEIMNKNNPPYQIQFHLYGKGLKVRRVSYFYVIYLILFPWDLGVTIQGGDQRRCRH